MNQNGISIKGMIESANELEAIKSILPAEVGDNPRETVQKLVTDNQKHEELENKLQRILGGHGDASGKNFCRQEKISTSGGSLCYGKLYRPDSQPRQKGLSPATAAGKNHPEKASFFSFLRNNFFHEINRHLLTTEEIGIIRIHDRIVLIGLKLSRSFKHLRQLCIQLILVERTGNNYA